MVQTNFVKVVFALSKHRIAFSKDGPAKYISHLDLMRTMQRAFLRAGIRIRHTEGFHPHPYISMPLPLPLGFSSDCEILEFGLEGGATIETLPSLINQALPSGITVHRCYEGELPFRQLALVRYLIQMEYDTASPKEAAEAMKELLHRESLFITKRSKKAKKGETTLDIIPLIDRVEQLHPEDRRLALQLLLRAQNPGLNPSLLISAFSKEYPEFTPDFTRFHREALFTEDVSSYQ